MVDAGGRRVIGKPASESEGMAWVRGFREGETLVRILQPTKDWWKFPEHYSPKLGFFACNSATNEADPVECIGCSDPAERVRNRSFKFAFNAVDKDGRIRVFKLGSGMRKKLLKREQALGSDILQRRDIKVIRIGSSFGETEYDYEWGDEYALDNPPGEDELNDLGEVITESYWEAVKKSQEDDSEPDTEPHEAPDDEGEPQAEKPARKSAPAKKAAPAAKKTAAPAKKTAAPRQEPAVEDATPDEPGPDGEEGDVIDPNEAVANMVDRARQWEPDDIRDALTEAGIEFPPRAPKPRLLGYFEQGLIDGKIPPF